MALPPEFNDVEHLQSVCRSYVNRLIREDFSDLGDDSWEPTIATPRASMRTALTHKDSDNLEMTVGRLLTYYLVYNKARDLQAPLYGIPTTNFQQVFRFKPQIELNFLEDLTDVEKGYRPTTGEIKIRLMNESSETITESKLTTYANRIKTNFGASNGFVWKKGKTMVNYSDLERGYHLKLFCRHKSEGKRLIEQILDIQQHIPDWKYMNISENEEPAAAYPTIPPNQFILGKNRRAPRKRPIADVRFRYSVAHIYGIPDPIVLYDRVMRFRRPLVASS